MQIIAKIKRNKNVSCSIGSLGLHNSQACVSNITVRNSKIRHSDNGPRIKTWQGGTGAVSGVRFESIVMENVKNCIVIDRYYCLAKQCSNQTSAVYVSDVSYASIRGVLRRAGRASALRVQRRGRVHRHCDVGRRAVALSRGDGG